MQLLVAYATGNVCVFDLENWNCVGRLEHPTGVTALLHFESNLVVSGCTDRRARIWCATGSGAGAHDRRGGFSIECKSLSCIPFILHLLLNRDVSTLACICTLPVHQSAVTCLLRSGNGAVGPRSDAVSSLAAVEISGNPPHISDELQEISCLGVAGWLLTGAADGTVCVWDVIRPPPPDPPPPEPEPPPDPEPPSQLKQTKGKHGAQAKEAPPPTPPPAPPPPPPPPISEEADDGAPPREPPPPLGTEWEKVVRFCSLVGLVPPTVPGHY